MVNDPAQAAEEMSRWADDLQVKAQKYQDLHGRMAEVSVTETSAGSRVSVTVDANGVTTDIQLGSAARGMEPAALAAELMACTHRAQAKLRARVTELVHDAVGTDAAGEAIIGQYAQQFPELSTPEPATFEPPPTTYTPATPPHPESGTRKPDRDHTVSPDEPDDDDLYFQRKSWLE